MGFGGRGIRSFPALPASAPDGACAACCRGAWGRRVKGSENDKRSGGTVRCVAGAFLFEWSAEECVHASCHLLLNFSFSGSGSQIAFSHGGPVVTDRAAADAGHAEGAFVLHPLRPPVFHDHGVCGTPFHALPAAHALIIAMNARRFWRYGSWVFRHVSVT